MTAAEKGPSAALGYSRLPAAGTSPPQSPDHNPPCTWTLLSGLSETVIAAEKGLFMICYHAKVRNIVMEKAGCSKRSRCKARENLRNEAYEQYAAVTKGERNAADGLFSAAC